MFFCASITDIECKSLKFVVENGFLLSDDEKTLYRYFGADEVVNIPPTVIFIKGGAFSEKQIKQINIPKSVKFIGDNPFAGISSPDEFVSCVRIDNQSSDFEITDEILYDIRERRLIALVGNKPIIRIKDNVKSIGRNAFFGTDVTYIFLSNSIEFIDETAFLRCFNLKIIYVPMGMKLKFKKMLPNHVFEKIQEIF